MKAQLYDDADYVRIFDIKLQSANDAIMDCHSTSIAPIGLDAADLAMGRCGLRRKSKWKRYPKGHFYESQVSFKR